MYMYASVCVYIYIYIYKGTHTYSPCKYIYICQYIIPKYMTSWLIAKHLLVYKLGNSVLSMYIYIYIYIYIYTLGIQFYHDPDIPESFQMVKLLLIASN